MDITEINKVASRKRMSADVEKLREKVSRENKKIIKLKVAQDTAYWDLKEKLRQVETNHEKLQQNMLEVQMQYETVSGQYQDELRHRAETLNKLASTREICSILEDYSERLRDTLSRCKTDQAALYEAYQKSGQLLHELKTQQLQQQECSRNTIDSLQDKLKLTTEHQNQLLQYFTEEKQRAAAELKDVKENLRNAIGRNNDLQTANIELSSKLDSCCREIEKKNEDISNLQKDIKELINQFNSQANEMKNEMMRKEKDLKEYSAANESLKQALHNQEMFTKSVCEQTNQLQEKIAVLEEDHTNAGKLIKELEVKLQEAKQANDRLTNEIRALDNKNIEFKNEIALKNEHISNTEQELNKLKEKTSTLDVEKSEILAALEKAGLETQAMISQVKQLTETGGAMENKILEIEGAMQASRDAAERKQKELNNAVEAKNKELENKTSTISQLMNEVKTMSDNRAKLETTIQNMKRKLEEEQDAAAEREKRLSMRVEQLEVVVKTKDMELSKNLSVVLELRSDKERLNEKIQSMQNMIENIQKEITRPAIIQPRIEPDLDDNAVMLTPASMRSKAPSNIKDVELGPPLPPKPKQVKEDSLLFNFLSDNSMDGDVVDPNLINRRFEALSRGEQLSPLPLSAMSRRRSGATAPQGGLRHKQLDKDEMSLSQVKASMKPNKPRMFFKNKRNEKSKYV